MKRILVALLMCLVFILNHHNTYAKEPKYVDNLPDALALSESTDQKLLVVFTAEWCPSCQVMKQALLNSPATLEDHLVCYINYDANPELVKEYRVRFIPDYFILHRKIETKRKRGFMSLSDFKKWLDK